MVKYQHRGFGRLLCRLGDDLDWASRVRKLVVQRPGNYAGFQRQYAGGHLYGSASRAQVAKLTFQSRDRDLAQAMFNGTCFCDVAIDRACPMGIYITDRFAGIPATGLREF